MFPTGSKDMSVSIQCSPGGILKHGAIRARQSSYHQMFPVHLLVGQLYKYIFCFSSVSINHFDLEVIYIILYILYEATLTYGGYRSNTIIDGDLPRSFWMENTEYMFPDINSIHLLTRCFKAGNIGAIIQSPKVSVDLTDIQRKLQHAQFILSEKCMEE